MRKASWLFLSTFFFLSVCPPLSAQQHSLTLTTYYPSPFGAYDRLRLVSRDIIPDKEDTDNKCDVGTLYTAKIAGLRFCRDNGLGHGKWVGITESIDSHYGLTQILFEKIDILEKDYNAKINALNEKIDNQQAIIKMLRSKTDMQQEQINELMSTMSTVMQTVTSCCR
jgi:hypothetical protein